MSTAQIGGFESQSLMASWYALDGTHLLAHGLLQPGAIDEHSDMHRLEPISCMVGGGHLE